MLRHVSGTKLFSMCGEDQHELICDVLEEVDAFVEQVELLHVIVELLCPWIAYIKLYIVVDDGGWLSV